MSKKVIENLAYREMIFYKKTLIISVSHVIVIINIVIIIILFNS